MYVTDAVVQLPISWSNLEAYINISDMEVAEDTFYFDMSPLKLERSLNAPLKFVTPETSQSAICPCSEFGQIPYSLSICKQYVMAADRSESVKGTSGGGGDGGVGGWGAIQLVH